MSSFVATTTITTTVKMIRDPLLPRLRYDDSFVDGVLVCGGQDIPVHVCVLSDLSPFFRNAFSGPFKESREKRLSLGDATKRSVEVLLDYAYETAYENKLYGDLRLTLEVWALANMYEVVVLEKRAGELAASMKTKENIVQLLNLAVQYGGHKDTIDNLTVFAAQCFPDLLWKLLSAEAFRKVFTCKELVASEWSRLRRMREWTKENEVSDEEILQLLEELHIELLSEHELEEVLKDGALWIPREVLLKFTRGRLSVPFQHSAGLLHKQHPWICETCETVNETGHGHCLYCSRPRRHHSMAVRAKRTTVVVRVPDVVDGCFVRKPRKVFCRVGEFVLSVRASLREHLGFQVKVERRWNNMLDMDMKLMERLRAVKFMTWAKLVRGDYENEAEAEAFCIGIVDKTYGFCIALEDVKRERLNKSNQGDVSVLLTLEASQQSGPTYRPFLQIKRCRYDPPV